MGIRTWAAAAAVAACAWAGNAGAATVDLTAIKLTSDPPTLVSFGDSGRLLGITDSGSTTTSGIWYFEIPAGAVLSVTVKSAGRINAAFVHQPSGYLVSLPSADLELLASTVGNLLEFQTWMLNTALPFEATYSVSVSSAVPEPSTWAMMLIGFAGLSLVRLSSERSKAGSRTG